MIFNAQNFHLTARIMLGMGIIGVLWVVLDYFLLRPLAVKVTGCVAVPE